MAWAAETVTGRRGAASAAFSHSRKARFLKRLLAMLVCLAVAATVLASPPPMVMASQLPKGAVFLVIGPGDTPAAPALPSPSARVESRPGAFLWGFLDQFAVVKPHRSGRDEPPTLQMFVLVAPMKGQVGVHAVGSF